MGRIGKKKKVSAQPAAQKEGQQSNEYQKQMRGL
jgi:hypothetical protein